MSEVFFTTSSGDGRTARILSVADIARVRVERAGTIERDQSLAVTDTLDYGYEGCHAEWVQWFGEDLVIVTAERGRRYLWAFASGMPEPKRLAFNSHYLASGDQFLSIDADAPGIVRCKRLPTLQPLLPLPMRGSEKNLRLVREGEDKVRVEGGAFLDTLCLPSSAQRQEVPSAISARIEAALHELLPAHPLTPMIIAAAAHSFWTPPPQPWSAPFTWMPIYWYRHLLAAQPKEAHEMLALLDAIAAPLSDSEPEVGWHASSSAMHGAVMLALRHVQRRAAMFAEVCRSGRMPAGWWCMIFEPAPRSTEVGSRVSFARLPAALRPFFNALVPSKPEQLR